MAFEHWIFHELRSFVDYTGHGASLAYWRSLSGYEVDFILNGEMAIEVKATKHVDAADLKGLRALRDERMLKRYIVVSRDPVRRDVDGITVLPWQEFILALWAGELDAGG